MYDYVITETQIKKAIEKLHLLQLMKTSSERTENITDQEKFDKVFLRAMKVINGDNPENEGFIEVSTSNVNIGFETKQQRAKESEEIAQKDLKIANL